eukprot:Protomagalhaensia_wolfi_Nauph_80__5561@NODE_614_length_2206_cov_1024_931241_g429_i1_p1_GENE_NODE_614_length_2206_cov_1024_931241_g429_i1NODE_614_length_2206_cov_1024_931241_g429_i1_p1_ORF_typecomplete_len177_score23_65_NODE_614_length_2206_cov_1024_931241_g429_i114341964
MKAAFFVLSALATQVSGLFFRRGNDPCRCEGRWILNTTTWQEPENPSNVLYATSPPIVVDIWHAEDNDPKSVRMTWKASNTISALVNAQGRDFCANEVEISKGIMSTRMFALGAMGSNERLLKNSLLANLVGWHCDLRRETLTLTSPTARVTLQKFKIEPVAPLPSVPEPESVVSA